VLLIFLFAAAGTYMSILALAFIQAYSEQERWDYTTAGYALLASLLVGASVALVAGAVKGFVDFIV